MAPKGSYRSFLVCEALGLALMGAAYLLPREPRPLIPTMLVVIGFLLCSGGIGLLPSGRRAHAIDASGDGTQWLFGEGPSHGSDCGGHGGADGGGCGDGGGGH
jgi:hypothetical protein